VRKIDELAIAEPCSADWNAMEPRERGRFCAQCSLEVVDVSALGVDEARELAARPRETRLCVSYLVRPDGSIRFADTAPVRALEAPDVPVRSLTRRSRTLIAAAFAMAACHPAPYRRLAGEPPVQQTETPQGSGASSDPTTDPGSHPPPSAGDPATPAASDTEPCDPAATTTSPIDYQRVQGGVTRRHDDVR
jgi:hypothetical protein